MANNINNGYFQKLFCLVRYRLGTMIVSMIDIILYVGEGVRPMIEGARVFEADHILACGYVDSKITAYCRQSSKLNDLPHKIDITLGDTGKNVKQLCIRFVFLNLIHLNFLDYKNWQCYCSCKAGAGSKCKHIVAVLLHLNK